MVQIERVRTYGVNQARQSKKGNGSTTFDIGEPNDADLLAPPVQKGTASEVATLSVLTQLQEITGQSYAPQSYVSYAEEILESLDCLHLDILAGGVSQHTLQKISSLLSGEISLPEDPKIREILGLIRQRAEVELAKIEMSKRQKD